MTRDRYPGLCQASQEEYYWVTGYTDHYSIAAIGAFAVIQEQDETPQEYYQRAETCTLSVTPQDWRKNCSSPCSYIISMSMCGMMSPYRGVAT